LWCAKYSLCNAFCDLQKTSMGCLGLENNICKGACIQKESPDDYNIRVKELIEEATQELPTYLIVDQGRNKLERSCILVNKGVFCGMGYVTEQEVPTDLEAAKLKLTAYPSYL